MDPASSTLEYPSDSDRRFQAVFDHARDAMLLADDSRHFLAANAAAGLLLGRAPADLIGGTVDDIVAAGASSVADLWRAFLAEGHLQGALTIRRADGTTREVEFNATAHVLPGQHLSILRDITAQVQARHELEDQRALLAAIFAGTPIGIVFVDPDLRIVDYNSAWARIAGRPLAQARGQLIYEIVPALLSRRSLHERALRGEILDLADVAHVLPGSDAVCYYDLHFRPVHDAHGTTLGMLSAAVDVTDRHNRATQKDQFLGLVAHELKTPVTSVKAYTQLALRTMRAGEAGAPPPAGPPRLTRLLETIDQQTDRLTRLINDLLDASRLESGQLPLTPTRFDLRTLVADTVGLMQPPAAGFTITCDLAPEPCVVAADWGRIEQVLINLLQNAIKYAGPRQEIVVRVTRRATEVETAVRDFGVGIPGDQQGTVFERYFRARNVRDAGYAGLGLGLYISHGIVTRHGGWMAVESTEGAGSTFSFILPLA
ncbi:MAG TPA: PAS domain-containing sensor histidine kinase [Chloroflexia bacterium]|nr:PAS domain-containing sensor histidine kinase [Chloroflexia bacterium]